jgi:propionyl-CoA synthetase
MKSSSLKVLLIYYQSRIVLSWIPPFVTTKSFLRSLPVSAEDTTESLTLDPFSLKNLSRGPAGSFAEQYELSLSDPEGFWSAAASTLFWFKMPEKILDYDNETKLSRWFVGGQTNVCYNALDLHVEHGGRADQVALIYDSPVTSTKKSFTYKELLDEVSRFAAILVDEYDLKCGDRAVIYMPMIPEAVIAMLACARIGVIHSVVFGGFAPKELATRIDDCEPKVIISASCGVEQGGKITPYKPLLDDAIEIAKHKVSGCIIVQRELQKANLKEGRDACYQDLMSKVNRVQKAIPVNSTDPLYILYTSGTTGKPKGVIRDTGGLAVGLKWSMSAFYDSNPGDVYFAGSDIGWVVGHHYIVYAPLLQGCTTILYEGKPVFTPDAGAFWRMVEEYKIKTLFAAPTAFRAIKQLDPHGLLVKNYNISSLNAVFLAGERSDPDTLRWCENNLGVPAIDHWWQTELAYPGTGNALGLGLLPPKYGACVGPVPGYDIRVLNKEGFEVPPGTLGDIVIKLPLPPGSLLDLYKVSLSRND